MTYSEYYEQWKKQKNGSNTQEVSTSQNSSSVNIKKNTSTPQTTYSDYYKQWKERWTKSRAEEEEKARKLAPVKNVVNRFLNAGESASEGIKQGALNKITDVTNRGKYIGKNLEVGTLQGTAGIPQAILTESANEMRKGQEKDANGILNQIGKAIVNNKANNVIDDTIRITKSDLETIKDKDKNLWEKLVGITTNHVSESSKAVTPGYSIFSALNQTAGKIAPQASNVALDLNNKISAPIKDLQQRIAEEGQNYDGVTRFLGEGANVVGNMAPSIVAGAITKNPKMAEDVALATMGLSAKGQSTNEAMDKGADLDEAVKIGDTKALIEVGTEKMTGGAKLFGGGTTAEEALRKQIKDNVKNKVLKTIANAGLDIAGEGLEETVSDVVDTAIDKGTVDKNASYSWGDWGKTQGITALTTLALNGLGIGGNAITQRINNIGTAPIQQTQNQPTAPINTLNQQNQTQSEQILPIQQINQEQNNVAQNGNMEQIDRQRRLAELKSIDTSEMGFIERGKIKTEIRALEQGYNSIEEYQKAEKIKREQAIKEYEQRQVEKKNLEKQKSEQLKKDIKESTPIKNAQFEIIQKTNPMLDDYHTGIRSPKDIKTFNEVINDEESFAWGDFSKEDAQKALEDGKITIYSSYPIENGAFVSTSRVQAEDYAGGRGNKVYSKEVPLEEVAWINGDEGQYAKVETLANNQEIVYNNFDEESNENESGKNQEASNRISEKRNAGLDETSGQEKQRIQELYRNYKNDIKTAKTEIENYIKEDITSRLPISKTKTESFIKSIMNNEEITQKGIYDFLKNNNEYKYKSVDEEVRDIRNYINSTSFNFSESEINELRYVYGNLPRNIKYSNNGVNVDQFYEELSGIYPDYFDKSETINSADRAIDIVEFMKNNKAENINIQEVLTDDELNDLANKILENKNGYKEVKNILEEEYNNQKKNVILQNKEKTIAPINNNMQVPTQPIPPINNTQGETINWNEIERPEGKIRKHYKSIIESSNTTAEAKKIARELMGSDTYVARSNNELLNEADRRINTAEPDTELNKLLSKAINNEKIKDVDIAVGERLIEYYSKIGDKAHLQDAIHATALAGTQAGRTVQAMALLNHMTPQGQVVWLDRSINKMNNELQQKYKNRQNVPQFKLTPEMQQKIMETNNQEEMTKALDEVYEELGQQVPKTLAEQIDEWRYFSMLANIKTHGRNMIGNFAMGITQRVKNKVAGAIEGTAAQFNPNMERTHTLRPTSKEVKQFAKKDVLNADVQTELGMNENKYTPQSRLQNARKTFKNDILNNSLGKLFDFNSKLLEVEDNIGLKSMYVNALGEYITANNIDVNNITDAQLQKARKHAIKEAQEATFHQASALATALNQMGRTSNIKKFALDAAVPFKKTPINVAKTGVQYSPVGLIKSAVFDIGKVRRGNISVNEYIDNISKGLTGTGITFLGYALAQAGILKASGGDDDKKEKYDEEQGKQKYSIEIGGKTATLDWLSPAGIPLFIGAEINQQFNQTKKEKTNKSTDDNETLYQIIRKVGGIGTGLSNIMNPMTEMSMVSGLTSILSSYNKENAVGDVIVNTGKSYINQFVPTALGQLARTTDEYERTTKSTKTGTFEKAADSTINQIKSKVPGLRQTLPIKTDIWGKEIKQSENLPFKAFNNFINPSTIKDVSTNKVDKELNNLYSKTKNGAIIPKAIENKFTIDGTDYRMSNKEYAKYYKNYGKTSYNLIKELISNEDYKSMNTEQKEKAIENVYSYAKEKNKVDYAKANKLKVEPSTLYNTMEELKSKGGNQSSYLQYISKTTGVEKESERNKILAESDYTPKTKSIIYSNGTGKDDKFYNTAGKNIDIDEYLNYKTKITNKSKKEEVVKYVNSNISKYNDRLLILANKYKLSNNDRKNLAEYINTLDNYMEIYEKLNKNYVIKNGKVFYK